MAVGKWYDFHEFGWYMGNVGILMYSAEALLVMPPSYRRELAGLDGVYRAARGIDLAPLCAVVERWADRPMMMVGSGAENGGDKLVHGSGGISQPRAE